MAQSTGDNKPLLILLVDDNLLLLELLADLLKMSSYDVVMATDGYSALEVMQTRAPDLILADIWMPNMDGYQFLEAVRSNPQWRHIPFAFVTADDKAAHSANRIGVDGILYKPFEPEDLLELIKKTCSQPVPVRSTERDQRVLLLAVESIPLDTILTTLHSADFVVDTAPPRRTRLSLAVLDPGSVAVVGLDTTVLGIVRDFELSSNVPIVLATESPLSLERWPELFVAGADEICSQNGDEMAAALRAARAQYDNPALLDWYQPWYVLVATGEKCVEDTLTSYLAKPDQFDFMLVDTDQDCLEEASLDEPDLILLDADLSRPNGLPLTEALRKRGVKAPVILIAHQESATVRQRRYELGIRDCLLKPVTEERLAIAIDRLRRGKQPTRREQSLSEIWIGRAIATRTLAFEAHIREEAPKLAAMMAESAALNSGLIHDIRNSLEALSSQVKRWRGAVADDSLKEVAAELSSTTEYASFLLDTVGEARFKGTWAPKLYPGESGGPSFIDMLEHSRALACLARPDTEFRFNDSVEETAAVRVDQRQMMQALAALLIAAAGAAPEHLRVVQVELAQKGDSFVLSVALSGWPDETQRLVVQKLTSLEQVEAGSLESLLLLTARKIVLRHGGDLHADEYGLILELPTGGWPEEGELRISIAGLADGQDALLKQRDRLPPIPSGVNVAPLVTAPGLELVRQLERIESLVEALGEAGRRIHLTARYATLLTRNLIITSAGFKPQLRPVHLKPLFESVYQLRQDYLRDCDVTMRAEPGTPAAQAEELGLLQVLVNLVINAVEAMEGEGELTVLARPHPDGVQITVSDTGHGIPPEERERIFDLLYTTKRGQERGVGLHVVRSIVDQFNGRISLESTVGQGTTFTIILPAAPSNHAG